MSTIVDFWKNVTFSSEENVILEDKEAMADLGERFTLQGMPEPFIGNVENAKIYLLSLNPGAIGKKELEDEKLQELTKKNLLQENDCPFFYLANEIKTMDGAKWWRKRLVEPLTDATKKSEKEVIKAINDNICNLEIIPYHSKDGSKINAKVLKLPSAMAMKNFVQELLTKDSDSIVIVMRSRRYWEPCLKGIKSDRLIFRRPVQAYTFNTGYTTDCESKEYSGKLMDLLIEKLF